MPSTVAFTVPTTAPFTPPYASRVAEWPNAHLAMVGERLRDTAYGWPEGAFEELYRERRILNKKIHLINDPEMIGHVLLNNHENYAKPEFLRLVTQSAIGRGLFLAEGADWRGQRKIVAPTFSPNALMRFNSIIADVVQHQVAAWPTAPSRINMAEEGLSSALKVISDTLFSGDVRLTSKEASAHLTATLGAIGKAPVSVMLGLPEFSLSPAFLRGRRGRLYLRGVFGAMVDERVSSARYDDFFGGLVAALYAQYPPAEARALAIDNAFTFDVAGHETTAVALAWTSYLLAAQPELQEEARAEAVAALAGDVAFLPERLPLLRQIIEETMRLYPPLHRIERQALGDDEVGGVKIKKGDIVSIWPMVIHRHRAIWDRPDVFDHMRFTPDAKARQHRFQYLPFGAGPRICVGMRLAMNEILIVMAHWLAARRFETVADHGVRPVGGVTLRPMGGMPLLVSPV